MVIIFIFEWCRANDTYLQEMEKDIYDIKKEFPKLCNNIGQSSVDIKTHHEK